MNNFRFKNHFQKVIVFLVLIIVLTASNTHIHLIGKYESVSLAITVNANHCIVRDHNERVFYLPELMAVVGLPILVTGFIITNLGYLIGAISLSGDSIKHPLPFNFTYEKYDFSEFDN